MRAGTEFKGHPLHLDILVLDGFLQRKLRQETVGSNIIGIDSNQYAHHAIPTGYLVP
jgi:hypothetical protein